MRRFALTSQVANLTKIVDESCGTCKQIAQAVNDAIDTIEQTLARIEPNWEKDPIWKAVVTALQAILTIVKDLCPNASVAASRIGGADGAATASPTR
jgi:hypothetical protein